MLTKIVEDYKIVADIVAPPGYQFVGWSSSNKNNLSTFFDDPAGTITVLDIGFGAGHLGTTIKADPRSRHWHVDGVEGFYRTCCNVPLFETGTYRHVWHGLAQELGADMLASYDLICFFDVIEHLEADLAKQVLIDLLSSMKEGAKLAIGTPLWFLPQGHGEDGDLEPHLCGIPVTSFLDLKPSHYSVSPHYLVGTFLLDKSCLKHIDKFVPTSDRGFNEAAGKELVVKHDLIIDHDWHPIEAS
jgi:hypothetical protein